MSDVRNWRRGGDWGRPYEDDPYWDWRGENRDWRRESRDYYGERDRDFADRDRGRGRSIYGRDDWTTRAEPYGNRGDDERWAAEREEARYGRRAGWVPDYAERDRARDPRYTARRAMGGSAPGGPWDFDEPWRRGGGWNEGWQSGGYERRDYERDRPRTRVYYRDRRPERSWWDRASDEVSSWFGDEEAERRRERDYNPEGYFRGRGPRGYVRSDERIREDVSDRLTDNPILDATDIEVSVSNGEVTLTGHVDSRYSKRLAEDLAEEVSGVRHVQNNLRVRDVGQRRESISGTYSGIAEGGRTSDIGRIEQSGVSGSSGTGNTTGTMSGSMARSGETTTGAPADRTTGTGGQRR